MWGRAFHLGTAGTSGGGWACSSVSLPIGRATATIDQHFTHHRHHFLNIHGFMCTMRVEMDPRDHIGSHTAVWLMLEGSPHSRPDAPSVKYIQRQTASKTQLRAAIPLASPSTSHISPSRLYMYHPAGCCSDLPSGSPSSIRTARGCWLEPDASEAHLCHS